MNLIAIAIGTVPDVDTGRRLHELGSLSDKDAAKVLFHRRKQETGYSEQLRSNQQRLAAISLLCEADDGPELISRTWQDGDEASMLDVLAQDGAEHTSLVTWGGEQLPVIACRALKHGRTMPSWLHREQVRDLQLELAQGRAGDLAPLHEIAALLDLPGLPARPVDAWEAMLADRADQLRAELDLQAIHTYLIALRQLQVEGARSASAVAEHCSALRDHLSARSGAHLSRFLEGWDNA